MQHTHPGEEADADLPLFVRQAGIIAHRQGLSGQLQSVRRGDGGYVIAGSVRRCSKGKRAWFACSKADHNDLMRRRGEDFTRVPDAVMREFGRYDGAVKIKFETVIRNL